jgi:hypothetical protein
MSQPLALSLRAAANPDAPSNGETLETPCVPGRSWDSPRLAWQLAHGPIRPGRRVCHRCDGAPCINPAHLFLVKASTADKRRNKRRGPTAGERNTKHKLTEAEVLEIRGRWSTGAQTMGGLGREFGVSPQNIWFIVRGRTWRHLLEAS